MKNYEFKFIERECFKLKFTEFDSEMIHKTNSIPGGKYIKNSGGYWKWPLSVRIYKQLKEAFGIKHEGLDREIGKFYLLKRHKNKPQKFPFGKHQNEAVELCLNEFGIYFHKGKISCQIPYLLPRGFALFMEMGTRKTSTAINIADTLHVNGYIQTVMVIAPLPIIDTWGNPDPEVGELAKHSSINHICHSAIGTKSQKEAVIQAINFLNGHKTLSKKMKWLLINPESIGSIKSVGRKKVYSYLSGLEDIKPDLLIIDESTIVKNHTTQRGKLIERLLYNTSYKIIMSGNPTPKGGHEIFGQYNIMDKGIYGDNFYKFRDKYFDINYFNGVEGLKKEVEEKFNSLFHSACYVVRKKDCLDLPPKTYERRVYDMAPDQAKAYKEMYKEATTSMDDMSCTADVVITKYLRCSQITGGFLPVEDLTGKIKEIIKFKKQPGLDAMVEDILSLPNNEQFVIWARFHQEIEMIGERLEKEGISSVTFYGPTKGKDRIEARRKFREKEVRAFISSSAGSKGLNDLVGATYVFYYSNDYSAETRQQSEDRNHRQGSKGERITYIDYVARGTIDVQVLKVLQDNKDYSTALLEEKNIKKNSDATP